MLFSHASTEPTIEQILIIKVEERHSAWIDAKNKWFLGNSCLVSN